MKGISLSLIRTLIGYINLYEKTILCDFSVSPIN